MHGASMLGLRESDDIPLGLRDAVRTAADSPTLTKEQQQHQRRVNALQNPTPRPSSRSSTRNKQPTAPVRQQPSRYVPTATPAASVSPDKASESSPEIELRGRTSTETSSPGSSSSAMMVRPTFESSSTKHRRTRSPSFESETYEESPQQSHRDADYRPAGKVAAISKAKPAAKKRKNNGGGGGRGRKRSTAGSSTRQRASGSVSPDKQAQTAAPPVSAPLNSMETAQPSLTASRVCNVFSSIDWFMGRFISLSNDSAIDSLTD